MSAELDKAFAETLEGKVSVAKDAGASIAEAYRLAEIACGKANEEFHPYGKALVEAIYSEPPPAPLDQAATEEPAEAVEAPEPAGKRRAKKK